MKSWIFGRFSFTTLLLSIFCLYFLAFHFDFKIPNIPVIKTILARDPFEGRSISNTTKTVLFWNTMFSDETFYFGKGDVFRDCPINDCIATPNRTYLDPANFDAVLFHGNELDLRNLPTHRRSRQWYIYVNLESPENRPLAEQFYEDYFNLTMTYRLDSDLPWSYGTVKLATNGEIVAPLRNTDWKALLNRTGDQEVEDEALLSLLAVVRGKRKPVVAFVSNCYAKSGRLEYVKELSRYIGVDVYGKCGENNCPRTQDCLSEVVEPDYFFYLSFENSLCQDYVTEKLYNPLRYNVLPVVYGGANYTLFAPPHSYVNALDFDTPKDLAAYLNSLTEDPWEYLRYFQWKKYYKIEGGIRRVACRLCEFLHQENPPKVYDSLSDWYSRGKCPIQRVLGDGKYATRTTLKGRD